MKKLLGIESPPMSARVYQICKAANLDTHPKHEIYAPTRLLRQHSDEFDSALRILLVPQAGDGLVGWSFFGFQPRCLIIIHA